MALHLSGIFIYPVKSLNGFPVQSAEVDELGFVGDRRFLVADLEGNILTQRTLPKMALSSPMVISLRCWRPRPFRGSRPGPWLAPGPG